MTQYHVSKVIKLFGQEGVNTVHDELMKLHNRIVLDPKHPHELTKSEKQSSLAYLVFLKKKKYGYIKAYGCIDGRKQRATTEKRLS